MLNLSNGQQVYYFGQFTGLGIADYSKCEIVGQLQLSKALPGATIDLLKFPDGRLYRVSEWGGGFFNDSVPITYNQIKKHQYSDVTRVNERAVGASVDARSIVYIIMRAWDNSKSYLMEYDYTTGRFTILGNVNLGLLKILCIGNRILGIEEVLQPYRHYKFIQIDPKAPEKPKLLFSIDSSFWAKDYEPKHISPYFWLFKAYESCDDLNLMLSSFTNNDSLTKFYKIDFKNKKLVHTCTMDIKLSVGSNEGYKGYDFLERCKFELDYDLDNSSDTARNCSLVYNCPQIEQKIHDKDWDYQSDGSLDSIIIDLVAGNVDSISEFLIANYVPSGAEIIGNRTGKIVIRSVNKVSGSEMKKILAGITYSNVLSLPSPGERLIRTQVFVPWFDGIAYTRMTIPIFQNPVEDTAIWLCPESGSFDLSQLHFAKNNLGYWQELKFVQGFLNTNSTLAGKYGYLYQRGLQCPTETAYLNLNYYFNPGIDLGRDLVAEGGRNYNIELKTNLSKINEIQWWLNDKRTSSNSSNINIFLIQDTMIKVIVETEEGCVFQDSLFMSLKIDPSDVWMPDAFSPNGDNINDLFGIKSKYDIRIYLFEIYDRWGNQVYRLENFYTNDESKGWNGQMKNVKLNSGPFVYQILFEGTNGIKAAKAGVVNLIR